MDMHKNLRCAGCIGAFTEKRGVAPLAGIGVLEALFGGLGLYYAGGDIYSGIKDRSIGRTLWGAAQLPMAFAGGSLLAGGGRAAWADRLAKSAPRLAALPGVKHFGRAVDWTERAAEGLGGHISEGVGKGMTHVGLPRVGKWFREFGPTGKQMLGFMAAQQALGGLSNSGGDEYSGGGEGRGYSDSYAQVLSAQPQFRNYAPKANYPEIAGPQ